MRKLRYLMAIALVCACTCNASASTDIKVNKEWQQCVLAAIDSFPQNGGYYTGARPNDTFKKTAWKGLHQAYQMTLADPRPNFRQELAQPSFCSSATYAALIKALLLWDTKGVISRQAWLFMKPFVGIVDNMNEKGFYQSDGQGFWGMMNGNGPAVAVLFHQLKVDMLKLQEVIQQLQEDMVQAHIPLKDMLISHYPQWQLHQWFSKEYLMFL